MSENSVAIVILNWNTRELLERFLPAVIKHSRLPGVKIIVADNGSDDGSVQLIKNNFPEIELIVFDKNYGFAGGYNRALKEVKSTWSVLLNSDVEPAPGWLQPLIDQMNVSPDIAACVPKIKALEQRNMFEYAGAAGGFIDKWGYTFCRGRIFENLEEDHQQYDFSGEIFWGSGAGLMVQTELFNESGGLDEDFFAHMEEIDWCWRMKNRGLKIWYVAQSEIFHLGGGTLNAMSPRKTYLNFRNNLFMLYRNLPKERFYTVFFVRLLLDGVAAIKYLFSGEQSNFKAVFRAHMTFFKSLPHLKKERALLRKEVKKEIHQQIYPRSIVLDYFLKGRRKYSELKF